MADNSVGPYHWIGINKYGMKSSNKFRHRVKIFRVGFTMKVILTGIGASLPQPFLYWPIRRIMVGS